jgi:hypothetical protein
MQLNLPVVPITDLMVKNQNLVAATQGRGIWIIDDLTVFHQISDDLALDEPHLYKPIDSYRMGGSGGRESLTAGTNHPGGVIIHYYLPKSPGDSIDVEVAFFEADGDSICAYATNAEHDDYKLNAEELKQGGNTFRWNMRYPGAKDFEGRIFWWAGLSGPRAVPGDYRVRLKVDDKIQEQEFIILKDPRAESDHQDLIAQFDFIRGVNDKVTEAHEAIIEIREVREQLNGLKERIGDDQTLEPIKQKANEIDSVMTEVEKELYQTKNQSNQDPLNFPIRLTNKLAHLNSLYNNGNFRPTDQAYQVKEELTGKIDGALSRYYNLKSTEIPELNQMVRESSVEAVSLKKEKEVN